MGKLQVSGMKFHAYHGCRKEEASIGGKFLVDVCIEADFSKPEKSDHLHDAVDYCKIYELVKQQMAIRSNLIEHVAKRILNALQEGFPQIISAEITVTKIHPPIEGVVEKVSAIVSE